MSDKAPGNFEKGFEEDAALRSAFMRRLIEGQSAEPGASRDAVSVIPKTIVRFWHDGDDIPDDVGACMRTWEALRGEGFDIVTFHDASAAAFIAAHCHDRHVRAFGLCRHPAMRSDYFRLCYILSCGGLYVDADDVMTHGEWRRLYGDDRLKLQPLCYDIPLESMVPREEIWRDDCATAGRLFYAANDPLAAPAGHPVVSLALDRATDALLQAVGTPEIQATTGPGNLTAALVAHARELELADEVPDFVLMRDWHRLG